MAKSPGWFGCAASASTFSLWPLTICTISLAPVGSPASFGLICQMSLSSVPVSGLVRRSSAVGRPLEGWRVASKGLGPLPRRRGSALALGCGGGGRVALPLARAAAVWTG